MFASYPFTEVVTVAGRKRISEWNVETRVTGECVVEFDAS